MKQLSILIVFSSVFYLNGKCQIISDDYLKYISKADSCIAIREFSNATYYFNLAFISNNGKGKAGDRFKDANCWAILNNSDSAYFQLEKIANGGKFSNYQVLEENINFNSLKMDIRWKKIIDKIKSNAQQ